MIWVFTQPEPLTDEAKHLNALLDAGVDALLLRKPGWSQAQYVQLLEQLDTKHFPRVMLSGLPALAASFGLMGVHMSEIKRQALFNGVVYPPMLYRSAAIHTERAIPVLSVSWDCLLLSPVFDSISKKGYKATVDADFRIAQLPCKILALGGIDEQTAPKARSMGFSGIAAMGAVWKNPSLSINAFERIQQAWNSM